MTVKEASIRFDLDEKEIRKRQRDNMIIGIRKDGRSVVIPDNTEIIPSKSEVRSFLFQILKKRNNVETIISRSLCPTTSSLKSYPTCINEDLSVNTAKMCLLMS
mgnify:CR=1 FL=1